MSSFEEKVIAWMIIIGTVGFGVLVAVVAEHSRTVSDFVGGIAATVLIWSLALAFLGSLLLSTIH